MCNTSVEFQINIRKIILRHFRSPKYAELGHFTLLFDYVTNGRAQNQSGSRILLLLSIYILPTLNVQSDSLRAKVFK